MPTVSLHPIGNEIWEYSHDIRFWGMVLPHRMTVIRLPGRKLLLHSPTRCDEGTLKALSQIGAVTEVVAPNRFHDLFLEEWVSVVPEARLWIPPGMDHRFHRVPAKVCEISQGALWEEVACVPLSGLPRWTRLLFTIPPAKR